MSYCNLPTNEDKSFYTKLPETEAGKAAGTNGAGRKGSGYYEELRRSAKARFLQVEELQKKGLICKDGDFVPSVHYPPITSYPYVTEDYILSGYTVPEDGLMDVYVHFPFCEQHCVFCHYPGKVGPQLEEKEKYVSYLEREMDLYLKKLNLDRFRPRSILIGGGTPSYLPPRLLERFLKYFNERVDLSSCRQFNYDLDPNSLLGEGGKLKMELMKAYGVTRLTIGIQSLNDQVLKLMNRGHDAAQARESVWLAKEMGFDVNIEFIYGFPGQTFENHADVIEDAVTLPSDEIQLYRLKVQAYGDAQGPIIRNRTDRKLVPIPDFKTTMMMKQAAGEILESHGYHENLRRVFSKQSRIFSHYAYNQCCNLYDQIGFGLTGFSSFRDRFALNTQYFQEYYDKIDHGLLPVNRGYIRNQEQQARWATVLPLKNRDIRKKDFERVTGIPFDNVFRKKKEILIREGLLEDKGNVVTLTPLGKFLADEVVEQFNSMEFLPFPRDHYEEGILNPYRDNTTIDAMECPLSDAWPDSLRRLYQEIGLVTDEELLGWLHAEGEKQELLFARAREIRDRFLGNRLKLRGVIEISNVCRKDCDYCAMRCENKNLERYVLDEEVIMDTVKQIVTAGIHTVFLQAGQDTAYDEMLLNLIPRIVETYNVEVLLCLGQRPGQTYEAFARAGASSYILKYETSSEEIYRKVAHSDLKAREACIGEIRAAGMKVGTGNIQGLPGQTDADLLQDIRYAASFRPNFVSTAPFVPNRGTPLENHPRAGLTTVLNTMAIWRIALKDALIPSISALEILAPGAGQVMGLNAGANVMTINFTPKKNRDKYAIYDKDRFIVSRGHAVQTAERAGLVL